MWGLRALLWTVPHSPDPRIYSYDQEWPLSPRTPSPEVPGDSALTCISCSAPGAHEQLSQEQRALAPGVTARGRFWVCHEQPALTPTMSVISCWKLAHPAGTQQSRCSGDSEAGPTHWGCTGGMCSQSASEGHASCARGAEQACGDIGTSGSETGAGKASSALCPVRPGVKRGVRGTWELGTFEFPRRECTTLGHARPACSLSQRERSSLSSVHVAGTARVPKGSSGPLSLPPGVLASSQKPFDLYNLTASQTPPSHCLAPCSDDWCLTSLGPPVHPSPLSLGG